MSSLSTLPKGDSAWLLRKAIERIIEQVSVLETNIGVSTSGNSANTQIIFNDAGTLRGDPDLTFNTALNKLVATNLESTTALVVGTTATITGDLTVDTSTLKVDSGNNRVIVGHTSGASPFQVSNAGGAGFEVQPTGVNSAPAILSYNRSTSAWIQLTYGALSHVWQNSGTDAMTLNSTGLGVGVSPSFKLHVQENASNVIARFTGSNVNGSVIDIINTGTGGGSYKIGSNYTIGGAGEFAIYDTTAAATRLLISSTGNVGIGVTSPANRLEAQEAGTGSGLGGIISSTATAGGNAGYVLRTGGTNRWSISLTGTAGAESIRFYDVNAAATRMTLDSSGNVGVGVTPSAKLDVLANDATIAIFRGSGGLSNNKRLTITTGGAKVVFNISDNSDTTIARAYEFQSAGSNVMTIDSSGNLLVNVPTTAPTLATNSQMVFNLTSNTNLRISVRGTDGTTRTANITLA